MPFGLSTLHAIFASSRFAAMPMSYVICSPTVLAQPFLDAGRETARVRVRILVEGARELVDTHHDVDRDLSLDLAQQRQVRATDQVRPLGHEEDLRADREDVRHAQTFFTPSFLASLLTAITVMLFVGAASNGAIPTGFPRNIGSACCATDAKNPSNSKVQNLDVIRAAHIWERRIFVVSSPCPSGSA